MKTHFFYIVGILIAIIIGLLVFRFGSNVELVNYVNFALTITSLFLALVSIVYAFYSNSTFGQAVGSITTSSAEINNSSGRLLTASESLEEKIKLIPEAIEKIENLGNRFSNTEQQINTLLTKSDLPSVNSQLQESATYVSTEAVEESYSLSTLADMVLDNGSLSGLACMYIAHIADRKGRKIDVKIISDLIGLTTDYIISHYVVMQLIGLLHLTWFYDKEDKNLETIKIDSLHVKIHDRIYAEVMTRLDKTSHPVPVASHVERMTKVKNYINGLK